MSLPWSLFEHMVGNWLVMVTDPKWPARLNELLENNITTVLRSTRQELARLRLPPTTAGELLQVVELGRAAQASDFGGEEFEERGVVDLTPEPS